MQVLFSFTDSSRHYLKKLTPKYATADRCTKQTNTTLPLH